MRSYSVSRSIVEPELPNQGLAGFALRAGAGFAYLPGDSAYAAAVRALPGYAIERVVFDRAVPLAPGISRCLDILRDVQRPASSVCAIELRVPQPLTPGGFEALNDRYLAAIVRLDGVEGSTSVLSRTTVAPLFGDIREPSIHAFCYTVPSEVIGDFVISGIGDVRDDRSMSEADAIVHQGENLRSAVVDRSAVVEKIAFVTDAVGDMLTRHALATTEWAEFNLYSVLDVRLADLRRLSAAISIGPSNGIRWHLSRPPIADVTLELDVRRVTAERRMN